MSRGGIGPAWRKSFLSQCPPPPQLSHLPPCPDLGLATANHWHMHTAALSVVSSTDSPLRVTKQRLKPGLPISLVFTSHTVLVTNTGIMYSLEWPSAQLVVSRCHRVPHIPTATPGRPVTAPRRRSATVRTNEVMEESSLELWSLNSTPEINRLSEYYFSKWLHMIETQCFLISQLSERQKSH